MEPHLTQSIRFSISSARRLWVDSEPEAANNRHFAELASPIGVGHNLDIETQVLPTEAEGQSPASLKTLAQDLDHQFLKGQEGFLPTLEALAELWWKRLGGKAYAARIEQSNGHYGYYDGQNHRAGRLYKVQCLHRHHNPDLSQLENSELYGKCSGLHGHEYKFLVSFKGRLDEKYHTLMPWGEVDRIIATEIVDPLDGSYLNDQVGNTSGEIICEVLAGQLKKLFPEKFYKINLFETKKNSFELYASDLEA